MPKSKNSTYINRPGPQSGNKVTLRNKEADSIQEWMGKSAGPNSLSGTVDTQAGSGIPRFVKIFQNYFERVILGDGTAAPYPYTFRLNSTFDPNETGTGTQPKGRDQMAAIYNDYTVMAARYHVRFINLGTDLKFVGLIIGTDAPGNFSIASVKQAIEARSKYSKNDFLFSNVTGKDGTLVLQGQVPMQEFALETSGSLSEQFSAGVGANPSTPVRMHLFAFEEDGTAIATSSLSAYVSITYDVVYHGVVANTTS